MGTFNRLFEIASKALDKSGSSTSSATQPPTARQPSADWRSMVRGAAGVLTGDAPRRPEPSMTPPPAPTAAASTTSTVPRTPTAADAADRAAIARYDYLMQTADPHQIERIHQDAFAKLTPAQRTQVEVRMRAELPTYEQPVSASPRDLARATARSEAMQPGRMRGLLARGGSSAALAGAGVAAGGLLGLVAGGAVVSAVASPLLDQAAGFGVDFDAVAQGIDLDALTGGATGALESAGEQLSDAGEQLSGFGDALAELGIPGLGDLFGR
ncbi:MAG TPA: cation-transporting ATPase [Microbacterium sp.]|nr:cation-transporting ATPase [Microbacterium sp.]